MDIKTNILITSFCIFGYYNKQSLLKPNSACLFWFVLFINLLYYNNNYTMMRLSLN